MSQIDGVIAFDTFLIEEVIKKNYLYPLFKTPKAENILSTKANSTKVHAKTIFDTNLLESKKVPQSERWSITGATVAFIDQSAAANYYADAQAAIYKYLFERYQAILKIKRNSDNSELEYPVIDLATASGVDSNSVLIGNKVEDIVPFSEPAIILGPGETFESYMIFTGDPEGTAADIDLTLTQNLYTGATGPQAFTRALEIFGKIKVRLIGTKEILS